MRYLVYDKKVFVESTLRENEFFSVSSPDLYFITKECWDKSYAPYAPYIRIGTLCKDNNQNVIKSDVSLFIFKDARSLIVGDNVHEWIISVKQTEDVWHTRDIYVQEGFQDGDGYTQLSYLAINLSDTPLGNKFEVSHAVDVYDIKDYRLYHLENNKYHLIEREEK